MKRRSEVFYISKDTQMPDIQLSVLCSLFGGGDMNGISLLLPELAARIGFGIVLVVNSFVFWKVVLPKYKLAFSVKG